jgi:transcriptional regulator with XRE-family HTH domain
MRTLLAWCGVRRPFREGRLKTARAMAGLSMDELTRVINVSKAKIVAWEKGRLLPTARDLRALAAVYEAYGVRLLSDRDKVVLSVRSDAAQDEVYLARIRAWVEERLAPRPSRSEGLSSQRCTGCGRWISLSNPVCGCAGGERALNMPQRTAWLDRTAASSREE